MTPDTIAENLRLAAYTALFKADRRRAGRRDVAPELIPLLRAVADGQVQVEILSLLKETVDR